MKNLFLVFLLLAAPLCRAATDVAGVHFEERAQVGNTELVLNGAGMRSKLFFRVYALGLYLPERKTVATAVLAQAGPKRLHVVTLRELTAEQFADALVEGIRKNHGEAETATLAARVELFKNAILALKTAPKGAVVQIDLLPGTGTRLIVNGEKRGEDIPGEDFQQALLKIWLGERPAQDDLKDALLGK